MVLDHDANRAAAVGAGALEAAAALRAHAADVAVVEAALTLLCCAVGWTAARPTSPRGAARTAIAALTTHCAAPAAGDLASSALWRLACLTRTILESAEVDRRAAVAAELEGAGVRALLRPRRRRGGGRCAPRSTPASLLGDAPAEPPAPPAADGGSPTGDEEAARTASDEASQATTDEAASPSASSDDAAASLSDESLEACVGRCALSPRAS